VILTKMDGQENRSRWVFDTTFGQPIVKDGCGIFGIIRKPGAPKIGNQVALSGLACIKYRGSNLGAGYACFDSSKNETLKIKSFINSENASHLITTKLSEYLGDPLFSNESRTKVQPDGTKILTLEFRYSKDLESGIDLIVDEINSALLSNSNVDGRIFSYGRYVEVFKEVGFPLEVAQMFGLDRNDQISGDMWIAHTRQPTNSPGSSPIWSHPFCTLDCAIVHNGDISSFGANLELLGSMGFKSHVGTDSEVISGLLNFLVRKEGLSVSDAATVLTNPFEENANKLQEGILSKYKAARLDGPFAVVAGYVDENDSYLVALIDRSKFRPIVIGEDKDYFYVASEENQIRILSPDAKVWTPQPGSFFIASLKNGLVSTGTTRELRERTEQNLRSDFQHFTDATGMSFSELKERINSAYQTGSEEASFRNLSGQRYIGIGIKTRKEFRVKLQGYPGNCLANLNDGAIFEVYGSVGDDLGDTMHSGKIIVHGSARDVVGQALQGGDIFVRRSVGNRAAIQMREYKTHRPFLIVGETADDYLGEYMAGGTAIVLNLSNEQFPVGSYVGTGMVGGAIYVRGIVEEKRIGLLPKKEDLMNYLNAEKLEGAISGEVFENILKLEFPSERVISQLLPESIMKRVRSLFFRGKYTKPISIEYRALSEEKDEMISVKRKMEDFFNDFRIPNDVRDIVMNSEFTVIRTIADEEKESPVPPQEVPVEE